MELLAPAGNAENFFAALEAGADGVYVGAPGFNARNLARDLRLDEIAAMIAHCHSLGKKIYIAANSLILEKELPEVVETLGVLEQLGPDALIVQDLGIINLLRYYFPALKYHASTLMGAHNLPAVHYYTGLGCERVVLARELTLEEIGQISARSDVELEVFVHGAMCFSYSGLCLFSSYLGGKSGLRGRCVQPCRRSYSTGKPGRGGGGQRGSYLFSMNDLDGLMAVPRLREYGIASLKIEGRLRSANYVDKVVRAYRLVLDASPEEFAETIPLAEEIVAGALSRKVSSGYFFTPQPADAITPFHSGNLGLHLGRASVRGAGADGPRLYLTLKESLAVGDRLRFHAEPSGERVALTLKELLVAGRDGVRGISGDAVSVAIPEGLSDRFDHVDIYKVDSGADAEKRGAVLESESWKEEIAAIRKRLHGRILDVRRKVWDTAHEGGGEVPTVKRQGGGAKTSAGRKNRIKLPLEWWLRLDSVKTLQVSLPFNPDRFVVTLSRRNVDQAGQLKKMLGKQMRSVVWALPSIIPDRQVMRVHQQIKTLLRAGYRSFQIGHPGQVLLFSGERVFLSGDYTLNIINNQAMLQAAEAGLESTQLAIEADRQSLAEAIRGYRQPGVPANRRGGGNRTMRLGLTVYGAPPLFTSRIDSSSFPCNKPVVSPKNEGFVINKAEGVTQTRPVRPFSLLPYLEELRRMGLDYVVVDLTGGHETKKDIQEVGERLAGIGRFAKLSTFNYLGKLV